MTNLADRMHAGVSSARADANHRLVGNSGYRIVQTSLNTRRMRLNLPTVIVGSVVFQAESQTAQILFAGLFFAPFY